MSFSLLMLPHGVAQFTAQGTFLYVEEAPGVVRIRSENGNYELVKGSQILNKQLSGLITVENTGEAGQVSLKVGVGEYRPPQRDTIAISEQPPVEFAPGQQVTVEAQPAMEIAPGQQVAVSNLERVSNAFGSAEVDCPHTFVSNAARKKLMLKASVFNVNPVKVGAYELHAGESLTLETTAEVTVTGSDKIQYIEV